MIALYPCTIVPYSTYNDFIGILSHLVPARRAESDLEMFCCFPHPEGNSPLDCGLLRGAGRPRQAFLGGLNTVNHQTRSGGHNSH